MKLRMQKKGLSIRHKIIGGFIILILFSSLSVGIYTYYKTKENIETTIGNTALNIVKSILSTVDVKGFSNLKNKEDMNSEYYKNLQSHLSDIRKSTGLKYLYTMRKTNDNKYIYVVDSTPTDDKNFSALGDEEDSITNILKNSFNGNSGFEFHSDGWGNLISAYIPIKDTSGNIVGVLAADFDANIMVNQLNKFKFNICILVVIIIVLGIIIGEIFSIFLVRSLNKLKKKAELIKNGDLTVRFDKNGDDEIGELTQSFGEMVNNISVITSEIKNNTREVNAEITDMHKSFTETSNTAEEISQVINEIATGSLEQTSRINQVSTTMDEVFRQVENSVQKANIVSSSSDTSLNNTKAALNLFKTSIEKVTTVTDTIEATAMIIQDLDSKSKEITAFSETISEITSQTNLLSLNAAIEAARAGEQGKGFSIVANEIKDLAEQSSNASSQISEIANSMQNEILNAIKSIEKGVGHANESVASVNKVDSYLSDLQSSSIDTNIKIKEIINSIFIIEHTCKDSLNKIHELDDISRSFSSGSQQAAASTEEQAAIMYQVKINMNNIKNMTDRLNNVVNKFKVE
ncbi:methyl-accepting chemotaxis protein [Clostridium folliculivorans]|uniref:Methyl-accepting chemotaxis protein n=1 Tax=Clostridium folliculivorans TaxID=2886038 RepID=A0A9W5Y0Q0_9CLOT|nr:methyl-accepting chemotaxis protein [Clostridium folliculivorans]GKU24493.1 methyl-accepting chemotaxis protein [Clostridium folliculivorans]GKU30591.1 methyl-accepting chemotaxis protein [Clostridium folliculivorans]